MGTNRRAIHWHEDWIRENFSKYYLYGDLHKAYCERFGECNLGSLKSKCKRMGFHSNFSWTNEMREWLCENYPLYPVERTTELFNEMFHTNLKRNSMRNMARNLGVCMLEDVRKTTYGKRAVPDGTITKQACGYTYIKVKGKWVLYQRYLYEKEHGKIEKDYFITFRDGDITNFDLGNLVALPRRCISAINNRGWNGELYPVAVAYMELSELIKRSELTNEIDRC